MPNMNSRKFDHCLVVVKNKLFVISMGEDNCEVFDNIFKKFITIKSPKINCYLSTKAYFIENKIFVLQNEFLKIITFDTNKNEWSEEFCEVTKNLQWFSSVKVPCL